MINDETLTNHLRYLGLSNLEHNWDTIMHNAKRARPSYHRLLADIIAQEYHYRSERARSARLKRAKIPEILLMETFPFAKQPRLNRQMVMQLYDSLSFLKDKQDLVFIGPTGCGKTGLTTAYLVHAINQGHRGYFIDFNDLLNLLYQARGDHTEHKIMRRFSSYEVLAVDEVGYISPEKDQANMFFDLLRRRLKNATTIITTQLGFEQWGEFLHNPHLTAALLDRITVNCVVFNMTQCISIRPKNIVYATSRRQDTDPTQDSSDASANA